MPTYRTCSICKHIPKKLCLETLHTQDRLPKAVDRLRTIGGNAADFLEIRRCDECKTHYRYHYDYDGSDVDHQTGRFGSREEGICRLTTAETKKVFHDAIDEAEGMATYFEERAAERKDADLPDVQYNYLKRRHDHYAQQLRSLREAQRLFEEC